VGRRPWEDRGKEIRRYRLALSREDWAQIDKAGEQGWRGPEVGYVLERILREWADSDRKRANSLLEVTGPSVAEQAQALFNKGLFEAGR